MATVVALHAHPDDEITLTGGTLAKLAQAGHRTVIVVATDGHREFDGPIAPRLLELQASARVLGVSRVEHLGYADSGHGPVVFPNPPGRTMFVRADVGAAAQRLASILIEERPDMLLSYDRNGGYGHRDHVRVHEVGALAAKSAGVARVLNATMPRELLRGLAAPAGWLGYDATAIRDGYTARAEITHRIDVGAFTAQRMTALAEHRSILEGQSRFATIAGFVRRVPAPLRAKLFRWEWFAEEGLRPGPAGPLDDIFARPGPH